MTTLKFEVKLNNNHRENLSLIAFHIPLHSGDMWVSKHIRSTKDSHGVYFLIVGQTWLMFA